MRRGLEVRPSQGLEVWRVDVASRARNGAIVCWHKGLEVCGLGDVESKSSYGECHAESSPKTSITFKRAQQLLLAACVPAAAGFICQREPGRRLVRARWDACAGV